MERDKCSASYDVPRSLLCAMSRTILLAEPKLRLRTGSPEHLGKISLTSNVYLRNWFLVLPTV